MNVSVTLETPIIYVGQPFSVNGVVHFAGASDSPTGNKNVHCALN
jgi:hypothetical protein